MNQYFDLRCGIPNSTPASISSSPLFISVAESTEILRPMFQRGCAQAWAGVATAIASALQFRNGPPEAVSSRRRTPRGAVPATKLGGRHWKIALCSLSIGISSAPEALHRRQQQRAGHHRRFLVGEQQTLAGRGRRQRRAQPGRAADRGHHIIDRPPRARAARSLPLRPARACGCRRRAIRRSSAWAASAIRARPTPVGNAAPARAGARRCCARRARPRESARGCSASTSSVLQPTEPVEPRTATPIMPAASLVFL